MQGYPQLHDEAEASPGQPGLHEILLHTHTHTSVLLGELEDDFWGLKPVFMM